MSFGRSLHTLGGLLALALLASACGRSSTLGLEGDASIFPPTDTSLVDQVANPERWLPPPTDGQPPPPPPGDGPPWPPPPGDGPHPPPPPPPPPFDFGPPSDGPVWPDTGTCTPGCQQLCQLLQKCGLLSGGVGQCAQQCNSWPGSQYSCLKAQYCAASSDCSAAKACLPGPTLKADLVNTGFTAAVAGSAVTYTIKTCNSGQAAAGNFYVDLYYDQTAAPTTQEFGQQYKMYNSLAVGACVTTTFTRSNTAAGTYASWAQADADGIVSEVSESNNVTGPLKVVVGAPPPPPPPNAPDLTITNLQINVTGTFSVTVRYRFTICNQGLLASTASQVHVYYNQMTAPTQGQSGDKYSSVPALQPAACTTRDIYRYGTPQGSYSSYGQVDPLDTVKESDETNNVYGPVTVNVGSTPGADLKINSFTYTLFGASTVRYRAQICNVGTGSSGATQVHVYYNQAAAPKQGQSGDQATSVPTLQPGACTYRNIYRTGTPSGSYTSWAQVDPTNLVTETNESNNTAGPLAVTVGGTTQQADLTFTQFNVTASTGQIQYSVVVCNNGTAPASLFRVDFYYNRASAPTTGQYGNVYNTIPYLGAGSCSTLNRTYSNPPAGTYSSWAQVDAAGTVSESNENNNVTGPKTVVVGSSSSCSTVCSFAVGCGVFTAAQTQQCMAWCNGLTTAAKQCVDAATLKGSCADFKACNTPPPPPPPPPPGVCPDLCSYLITTCNLLPSNQYWTCVGACEGLTPAKISCAQAAKALGQCMQVVTCLL